MIHLKIYIPREVFLDKSVDKIVAEAANGHFGILPRHVDFTTILEPGILRYAENGEEKYIALDTGVLVKKGDTVYISAQGAVAGEDIETLHETVAKEFEVYEEKEKVAHTALVRLEADFTRRFLELRK
ncbi:MAG: F0F1 ATP synthase subunit epsilon [Candidatus Kapaibacterium sp.]